MIIKCLQSITTFFPDWQPELFCRICIDRVKECIFNQETSQSFPFSPSYKFFILIHIFDYSQTFLSFILLHPEAFILFLYARMLSLIAFKFLYFTVPGINALALCFLTTFLTCLFSPLNIFLYTIFSSSVSASYKIVVRDCLFDHGCPLYDCKLNM